MTMMLFVQIFLRASRVHSTLDTLETDQVAVTEINAPPTLTTVIQMLIVSTLKVCLAVINEQNLLATE